MDENYVLNNLEKEVLECFGKYSTISQVDVIRLYKTVKSFDATQHLMEFMEKEGLSLEETLKKMAHECKAVLKDVRDGMSDLIDAIENKEGENAQ